MDHNVTSDNNVSVDQLLSIVNNTLAATNNTIAHHDTTIGNLLSAASNSIAHTDSMISIYLGGITLFTLALTFVVQFFLARDKQKQILKAVNHIISNIANDENLRNQLIAEILKSPDFKKDFMAFIDISVRDKIDDLLPEDGNDLSLEKIQKGLQS